MSLDEKLWRVTFVMTRTVKLRGSMTGAQAEEKARDQVLFKDTPPIDEGDVDKIHVAWIDESVGLSHLADCEGNHCWHYECSDEEGYHEYCANCDPE